MRKHLTILTALLLGGVSFTTAFSQDKATLDLLVKKGVITQAEADQVAKQSSLVIQPKMKTTKKLALSGYMQTQFDYTQVDSDIPGVTSPKPNQEFLIRRAVVRADADLGNGISGIFAMDFAAGTSTNSQTNSPTRNLFDTVTIAKKFTDVGTIEAGYRKTNFAQEFVDSSSAVPTIELSAATQYFTSTLTSTNSANVALGGRHTGLYWQGETPVKGLIYRAGFTNGQQSVNNFTNVNNSNLFSYWGSTAYTSKVKDVDYTVGLNMVYSQNTNNTYNATNSSPNGVFGLNPYVVAKWNKLAATTEFLWSNVQEGQNNLGQSANASNAQPFGVNFTPTYRFTEEFEGVMRFAYLNTDGRGTNTNVIYDSASLGSGALFDSVYSVYAGVNWYIIGDSLKVMLGYEYLKYEGGITSTGVTGTADENTLRVRVQLMF